MYQIEVKRWLVSHRFPVAAGWDVTVDIDAMERGLGKQQKDEKRVVAESCVSWFKKHGVKTVRHPLYGRADLVAKKEGVGTFVVEVEGQSSKQKEQALYSALGQVVLSMSDPSPDISYCLAVPDTPKWEFQLKKIPTRVLAALNLHLLLVAEAGVREP